MFLCFCVSVNAGSPEPDCFPRFFSLRAAKLRPVCHVSLLYARPFRRAQTQGRRNGTCTLVHPNLTVFRVFSVPGRRNYGPFVMFLCSTCASIAVVLVSGLMLPTRVHHLGNVDPQTVGYYLLILLKLRIMRIVKLEEYVEVVVVVV